MGVIGIELKGTELGTGQFDHSFFAYIISASF